MDSLLDLYSYLKDRGGVVAIGEDAWTVKRWYWSDHTIMVVLSRPDAQLEVDIDSFHAIVTYI